ncbi:acylphosphatase-1 isoform X2 [Perca flavescens]|uniref:acylphosphatase-1 isoform X2 n=1 Tax=Perca flavescens TaxID=8167 RepID=UPI00106ED647|nr:acylphosphatase-1 isoform X2 [Perca flavescens]
MANEDLISVDYEIFGRVQGVFFRKYTQAEGKKLGLVGWVQNTGAGTVQGQLQGPRSKGVFANKSASSRHASEQTGNGMPLKSVTAVFIGLPKDVTEGG